MPEPEIRLIEADEFDEFWSVFALTFGFSPKDEDKQAVLDWLELDRTFGAFDDGSIVATSGAVSLPVVVPGGKVVPAAGITVISTLASHRRRGLMRQAMTLLLDQARRRGEPVATLWASESSIYGKVGFGVAAAGAELKVDTRHAALRDDAPAGPGQVRLLTADEASGVVPAVYAAATSSTPGAMVRRPQDWADELLDLESRRKGASELRYAVYEESGEARGYARFRRKVDWEGGHGKGVVKVTEMHAVDAAAYAELWRHLAAADLTTTVQLSTARVNEPLWALLDDPRRITRTVVADTIWLRVIDTAEALGARAYAASGNLVLAVEDPMGYAGGTFALTADSGGAEVAPSKADPDVRLGVADLSAAYLGAPRLRDLAWAGRIDGDEDAVALLDTMLRWPVDPFCTVHF